MWRILVLFVMFVLECYRTSHQTTALLDILFTTRYSGLSLCLDGGFNRAVSKYYFTTGATIGAGG